MRKVNRIVSILVTICFMLNTALTDIALGQTFSFTPSVDKLATPSIFSGLRGRQIQDIARLEMCLSMTLAACDDDNGEINLDILPNEARKFWESDSINKDHFFFNNVKVLTEGFYFVKCGSRRASSFASPRIYYAVFPYRKAGEVHPAAVFTANEWRNEHEKIVAYIRAHGSLPDRSAARPKDAEAIARYIQHERNIDALIRFAHKYMDEAGNKPFVSRPSLDRFNYRRIVKQLLRSLNIKTEPNINEGVREIQNRDFFIVDIEGVRRIISERFDLQQKYGLNPKNLLMTRTEPYGKEVKCFMHSSNNGVHGFVDSEAFEYLSRRKSIEGLGFLSDDEKGKFLSRIGEVHSGILREMAIMLDIPVKTLEARYSAFRKDPTLVETPLIAQVADLDAITDHRDYATGNDAKGSANKGRRIAPTGRPEGPAEVKKPIDLLEGTIGGLDVGGPYVGTSVLIKDASIETIMERLWDILKPEDGSGMDDPKNGKVKRGIAKLAQRIKDNPELAGIRLDRLTFDTIAPLFKSKMVLVRDASVEAIMAELREYCKLGDGERRSDVAAIARRIKTIPKLADVKLGLLLEVPFIYRFCRRIVITSMRDADATPGGSTASDSAPSAGQPQQPAAGDFRSGYGRMEGNDEFRELDAKVAALLEETMKLVPADYLDGWLNPWAFGAAVYRACDKRTIRNSDGKSTMIFSQKATFGDKDTDGENAEGLAVVLRSLAISGVKVAVVAPAEAEEQRLFIAHLNDDIRDDQKIICGTSIESVMAEAKSARYYYFKVASEPPANAGDAVTSITIIVREILNAIGEIAWIKDSQLMSDLHEAAKKIAAAA